MKKTTIQICGAYPFQFLMRTITESDIDYIRTIKNINRDSFFYKKEITSEGQSQWFNDFEKRMNDHMFVILVDTVYAGCIGTRFLNDHNDIYNVILGNSKFKGKGIMTSAMNAVFRINELFYPQFPNRIKVLANNPALTWYNKIGFEITNTYEDFVWMEFRKNINGLVYKCNISLELPIKK